MVKPGHPATLSIPEHDQVARGTLRSLIARAGLSIEAFIEALKQGNEAQSPQIGFPICVICG